MEIIQTFITNVNEILWGPPMLILLMGTHIFFTFRTGFIQKYLGKAIRLSMAKEKGENGDISQFGSLATALASTLGTGNIIGIGTAIAMGGPGAVFWCWLTGVFGIATKYAEALITVKYRVKSEDGRMLGGAMYVLERGLSMKGMAILFALFTMLASFGIGSMVQVNAIVTIWEEHFEMPAWIVGVVCVALTALVILGGVKSISGVCEKLVPFMSFFYMAGCIFILVYNYNFVIPAIKAIVTMAFTPDAAIGGFAGSGMMVAARYGVARGLFSNESGMGSAPIVAAAARTRNPVRQALVSSTGTFWDTVVMCAVTGIALVSSALKNEDLYKAHLTDGGGLTNLAFEQIPFIGPSILIVGIITFAYSTILGWAYYGERCAEYLGGMNALKLYRICYLLSVFLGSVISLQMVWKLADIFNVLMAFPNLVAILLLNKEIVEETKKYIGDLD